MAIRAQKLGAALPEIDYPTQLNVTLTAASAAVMSGDVEGYRAGWERVAQWPDIHRRLQGDLALCNLLAELQAKQPRGWAPFYYEAGVHLLKALKENPLEPARWNMLGVALYELGQTQQAERCFSAVRAVQPDHPNLRGNLKAVRDRRRRSVTLPFGPNFKKRLEQLAGASNALAKTVGPVDPASQKLSLVMIVKDEEEMLSACLDSVKDVVDEMIIVDTGSTDATVAIAESFGAKVIDFPWTGSFAEARNVSLDHASGDWVLHLDADERVLAEDAPRIRSMLSRVYREGFSLVETNYTGEGEGVAAVAHNALRVWRHRPEYRFEGAIHEQKTQNMPTWLAERFELTGIRMLHFGYLKEVISARGKSERNLELLLEQAKTDESPFNRFNIGTEYLQLRQAEQARRYLDQAWEELLGQPGGPASTGFGAMLALRTVRARREAGDLAGAQAAMEQALRFYPSHTDVVHEGSQIARDAGDLDTAIELAEQTLKMGDAPTEYAGVVGLGSYIGQAWLGELAEVAGQPQRAVEIYRQSLTDHPEFLGIVSRLARAELAAGTPVDQLLEELEPLVEDHLASAGLLLAHALYEREQIAPAKRLYERLIDAVPGHPIARVGLVECALSSGDLDAVDLLTDQIDADDPTAPVLARAALFAALVRPVSRLASVPDLLQAAQDLHLPDAEREAFAGWEQLLSSGQLPGLSAEAGLAVLELLNAALRMRDVEAAEQLLLLTKASELELADRAQSTAELFLRLGFLDSAAEEWLEWIDLEGPQANSVAGLAQIALAQGRKPEALALAQDALDLDQTHPLASRMVTVLAA
jgi:tetratricopeptide (TPR) repeat protein